MVDALGHDVRYALRQIRRAPGFAAIVILTLALGVGANTALFSLLNAIVLRPLPVRDPHRLAAVSLTDPRGEQPRLMLFTTFLEYRQRQRAFETLFAYSGGGLFSTEVRGVLSMSGIEGMTSEYFTALGIQPSLGRVISADDAPDVGEPQRVVLISHRFWQRQFGGDPQAIGEVVKVDGTPLSVIGVLPPDFNGLQALNGSDIFIPLTLFRRLGNAALGPLRPVRAWYAIGRLRDGVTREQARAEVTAMWPAVQAASMPTGLTAAEQDDLRAEQVRVESAATGFSPLLRARYTTSLYAMFGLTTLLLAIACVNLSGLLLARAAARDQEVAICLALGASRGRLVQQLLVESVMLAVVGTAIALPFAWWVSGAIGSLLWTASVPATLPMTPDARVLTLTSVIAIATGLLVALLPAASMCRRRAHVRLQPGRAATHASTRWGRALLVTQVALSLVLSFGAGLFMRSLANLRSLDSGFRASGILWTRVVPQPGGYRNIDDASYYAELVRQLSSIPGVESVALSHYFPAYFNFTTSQERIGRTDDASGTAEVAAPAERVSPRFFATVGASLLDGRDFTWRDDAHARPVGIINRALAQRLFPSGNAVGQRIRVGAEPRHRAIEVVGVVSDVTVGNIRAPHQPVVFLPRLQELQIRVPIVSIRMTGDASAVGEAVKNTFLSMGHEYIRSLNTLDAQVDDSILQERLTAISSSFFAAVAVLLAGVGLYGLLAYAVTQRTREIGVRMALGAKRSAVLRLIVREGLVLTIVGVAIGVPLAVAAARLIRALLFGLTPGDPLTLAAAAALFIVIGSIAGLAPAYRASSVDPMTALRCD
jgi:predicted permease